MCDCAGRQISCWKTGCVGKATLLDEWVFWRSGYVTRLCLKSVCIREVDVVEVWVCGQRLLMLGEWVCRGIVCWKSDCVGVVLLGEGLY